MPVNKVILIGNVGKEPETRYFDEGRGVANFSLATSERGYTTASGTQIQERTEWHNITVWRKGLVEIVDKYVHKGSKIYIEGKIRSRSYVDKQEIKRYVTEIYVENLELLDRKSNDEVSKYSSFEPPADSRPLPTPEEFSGPPLEMEEDDLPF